ncbi:hypothetical protein BTR23_22875 [Alkalihalophilus pseudofirmus]|uniref:DUF1190 domain-containing protein n=1 Tax=Alkalihalobacterium alkalinitrilicum TaxID=427920 RepID=UPI00094C8341|nr:DUF1190 domain-containing protein [Alkalihalobacterium alkalinitrilicum]OLO26538.1 hypothetical protein BTR23_22875 [Alkalihalophilus pseudofirmus]
MRKPKTDKLLKGIVGTSVALFGLTACSTNSQEQLFSVPEETNTQAASPTTTPPSPDEADCDTWTWDAEAEVYQCVQEESENYGHYYSGGSWFPTIAAFMAGQALGRGGATNANLNNDRRQDPNTGATNTQQSVNQNNQNNQTTTGQQTNRSNTNSGQVTNSRSGMGSGGTFGG